MKKILITGSTSYIGKSFEAYMLKHKEYQVDTISVRNDQWRQCNFAQYDIVIHVAGLVHLIPKKMTCQLKEKYYQVNTKLAIDVANKAKTEGVKQFIFMSTMSIYGEIGKIGKDCVITKDTMPNPKNEYGRSKLRAENKISPMQTDDFTITILRPPMVYGSNCKGNYNGLVKAAKYSWIFPKVQNRRAMIYIDNLCEMIYQIVENNMSGIFMPQDRESISTSDIVKLIADANRRKICFTSIFNPVLKLCAGMIPMFNKVFGNLVYEHTLSTYDFEYQNVGVKAAISKIEMNK